MALFTYCRAAGGKFYQYAALIIRVRQPFHPAFTDQAIQHTGQCPQVDRQHFFQFNRSNTRRAADRAEHLKLCLVAYYAGQLVMDTFGISIPGLRIAGGLIVAFIGFRMLFPQQKAIDSPEAKSKSEELEDEPSANIAFVPLAMPSTAGPGTIAMIISSASTVRQSSTFADWVLMVAPPLIFFLVAVILWGSLRSSGAIMRLVGKGGIEAISRLMGFLLVCMGVQFIINGILEIIKTYH